MFSVAFALLARLPVHLNSGRIVHEFHLGEQRPEYSSIAPVFGAKWKILFPVKEKHQLNLDVFRGVLWRMRDDTFEEVHPSAVFILYRRYVLQSSPDCKHNACKE